MSHDSKVQFNLRLAAVAHTSAGDGLERKRNSIVPSPIWERCDVKDATYPSDGNTIKVGRRHCRGGRSRVTRVVTPDSMPTVYQDGAIPKLQVRGWQQAGRPDPQRTNDNEDPNSKMHRCPSTKPRTRT